MSCTVRCSVVVFLAKRTTKDFALHHPCLDKCLVRLAVGAGKRAPRSSMQNVSAIAEAAQEPVSARGRHTLHTAQTQHCSLVVAVLPWWSTRQRHVVNFRWFSLQVRASRAGMQQQRGHHRVRMCVSGGSGCPCMSPTPMLSPQRGKSSSPIRSFPFISIAAVTTAFHRGGPPTQRPRRAPVVSPSVPC